MPDDYDKGPAHGGAATGISADYERERQNAAAQLQAATAGPRDQPAADNDTEMKNPDGEWEDPAPMTASHRRNPVAPGPDQAGNSKGDGTIDPQGQQGGTYGGSAARPSLKPAEIDGPLAGPEQRKRRSSNLPG